MVETKDVAAVGRIAKGIRCMKLNTGAYVQGARPINSNTRTIVSVTKKGLAKQTPISEFSFTNRNTKGSKLQGTVEGDEVIAFEAIGAEVDLIVTSNVSQIRFALTEVPTLSRSAQGVKVIKLNAGEYVVGLEKI